MNIYRNIDNGKLYTINHLIKDIKHLNNNEFAGIYATPYNHNNEEIIFKSKDVDLCNSFVSKNFNLVSH